MCWSLSRWMILEVHSLDSDFHMMSGKVLKSLNRHNAALCLTTSIVSLKNENKTSLLFESE